MKARSQYQGLGVDAAKVNVRKIFGQIVHNDFPGAFVNIGCDPVLPNKVFTKHPDGDGSKFVQRLLHFLETGDKLVIRGAVDDALSMNTGDIAASGFVFGRWVITQILNVNGLNVPKEVIMEQIAIRMKELLGLYCSFGFTPVFLGGETADLPHQVYSNVYDVDVYAEDELRNLVVGNVDPGDRIYGFASDGQARWEQCPNSGIMSNGLTLARTCLMRRDYGVKYPFLAGGRNRYRGRFDVKTVYNGLSISQALMSPTRQWAILIRLLIRELKRKDILYLLHGISMNTGGGATKIAHLGRGIIYRKVMPDPSPIFYLIKHESRETWRNMFQTFNCGVGIDVVGADDLRFTTVLAEVERRTGVKLYELGVCRRAKNKRNQVILKTPYGTFDDY